MNFKNKNSYSYRMEVLGNGDNTQWKCLVLNAAVERVFSGQTKLWEAKVKKESKGLAKKIMQREKETTTKRAPVVSQ